MPKPKVEIRCRYCEPDDPLAKEFCRGCQEVFEDVLLAEASRDPDLRKVLRALAQLSDQSFTHYLEMVGRWSREAQGRRQA